MAELAARQHGAVSHGQLVRLGVRGSAVTRRIVRGHLHRLHRGVYAVGHPHPSDDGRLLAAVLATGPDAVVSHLHAAALLGLADPVPGPVHVTTSRRPREGTAGVRLHRTRRLHPDDLAAVRGIPVASVARTLVDLTDELSSQRLGGLLREAAFQRLLDLELLDAALARAHGRRRLARLTVALETHRPGKVLRSELERRFLALCREAGLPEPETNVSVHVAGRSYEVDCLWRAERVVVELDGAAAHKPAHAFEADRERDAALYSRRSVQSDRGEVVSPMRASEWKTQGWER